MAPGLALAPPPQAVLMAQSTALGTTLTPAAAVVAARAEVQAGRPSRAMELLNRALPTAGALAPLVQLEAAQVSLLLGRDPWAYLAPLLQQKQPPTIHRQAQQLALQAVQTLSLPTARIWMRRHLSPALRRLLQAELILREQDTEKALGWLRENLRDPTAGKLALSLPWQRLSLREREVVAQALFHSGFWRESHELLSSLPSIPAEQFQLTFTRARVAYRLELWEEAISWFRLAEQKALTRQDRASCGLFQARAWEQLGQWLCAEEMYRRILLEDPNLPEGWHGLFAVLARTGRGKEALRAWLLAPARVRPLVASKLCATLALHGFAEEARSLGGLVRSPDPAFNLCQAFLERDLGNQPKAQQLLEAVMADPRSGRLRELAAMVLPLGEASPPPSPTKDIAALAHLAVTRGLTAARQALAQALAQDPRFAPLFLEGPRTPPLGAPVSHLLASGLSKEAAALFPHLLPEKTPEEMAWKATFLAENENWEQALAVGEKLWHTAGDVPACWLPEALLRFIVPQSFATLFPGASTKDLLFSIARQESRFNHQAISPVGARGMFQIMPETSRRLTSSGTASGDQEATNLAYRYLQQLRARLGADPALLAAAYNAGEPWVSLWLGETVHVGPVFPLAVPYGETQRYVLAVLQGLWLSRHLK